jgi:hypothetical protein
MQKKRKRKRRAKKRKKRKLKKLLKVLALCLDSELFFCKNKVSVVFKKIHMFRVMPKKDLAEEILSYCREKGIRSGIIIGIIGSLEKANLGFLKKLPGHYIEKELEGPMEIVSGQGSVALLNKEIITHVHLTVGTDKETLAGHLAKGCIIFSTAEVVIGELEEILKRKKDDYTGLNELVE